MPPKWVILAAVGMLWPLGLFAQDTLHHPCRDSLFLRLKKVPSAALTTSERRYLLQKEQECAEFLAKRARLQGGLASDSLVGARSSLFSERYAEPSREQAATLPSTDSERAETFASVADTLRTVPFVHEPMVAPRNLAILAAIVAAFVGLAIALGRITPSPF